MKGLMLFGVLATVFGILLAYLGLELFYFHTTKKTGVKADSTNETEVEELEDFKYCYKNVDEK